MVNKDPVISKKKQMIPQQSYLSEDLVIEEILTRLPPKSVFRFKSVSKHWYSTLSSSDFTNAHLLKSSSSHPSAPFNTLFINSGENFYIFSYNDDQVCGSFEDHLVKVEADFGVEESLIVAGSCNGLICLTPPSDTYFIIWNPATCKMHKYLTRSSVEPYRFKNRGFGYVSSVDDYNYFRILFGCDKMGRRRTILYIYSLRENKWREKFVFDHHDGMLPWGPAFLINQKLYWSAYTHRNGIIMASFDLGLQSFDLVKLPLVGTDFFAVMGGCLSKCNRDTLMGDNLLHILEPPAVIKSIALPPGLRLDSDSKMIGFTSSGKVFVTGPSTDDPTDVQPDRALGIFDTDTRTKPVQYTMLLRFNKLLSIDRYVPSLVSPFAIEQPL